MADECPWFEQASFPALLRAARRTYGSAVRVALAEGGYEDIPRNGPYVIGGIARTGASLSEVIAQLGVSKQAAGQLVDMLVVRGYLNRSVDPDDRRRLRVTLTERGVEAATVIRSAVDQVDVWLLGRMGAESVARTRAVLGSLIEVQEDVAEGEGAVDPARGGFE